MSHTKRRHQPVQQQPQRQQSVVNPSPVPVPPPSITPAEERQVWQRRQAAVIGSVIVLLLVIGIAAWLLWPRAQQAAAPLPPAVQAPIAVVPQAPQAVAPIGSSGIACDSVVGLPVLEGATCIEQNLDTDDNVKKLENTYVTPQPADEVRRFFESSFQQNGWQTEESKYDADDATWNYELVQGDRKVDVKVESEQGDTGAFTRIKIEEK